MEQNIYWENFCKSGAISDYLIYKNSFKEEKKNASVSNEVFCGGLGNKGNECGRE
ncbi:MAG: hypothetical protein IJP34_03230 [Clostridia bacterium]|nr:hypothetical protein [Clostridia bacterium]